METLTTTLEISTRAGTDIHDLSRELQRWIADQELEQGWLLLFAPGSTAGLTTLEYESGAIADLKKALEVVAPEDGFYEHNQRWGDGNGFSHVRAALMGPSLVIPVIDGTLATGTWQQVILCDFDNRPRNRRILVQHLPG